MEEAPAAREIELEQADVPAAIFGDLQGAAAAGRPVALEAQGALERFAKRQKV